MIFDYATDMKAKYFDFTYDGQDYRFWAWKGDYLNLGAGAELGIYSRHSIFGLFKTDQWDSYTDSTLKMSMTLKDNNGNLIESYSPSKPQWWLTSFNPFYQDVQASNLSVSYTVNFSSDAGMYDAFYGTYRNDSKWKFDSNKHTATLNF